MFITRFPSGGAFAPLTALTRLSVGALTRGTFPGLCMWARRMRLALGTRDIFPCGDDGLAVVHQNGRRAALFVHGHNAPFAVLGNDAIVLHRNILRFFGAHTSATAIPIALVFQTAHEPPADSRDLGRVEREILLLCHTDGNGHEVAEKGGTAERPSAAAHAAHHLCLVAHTDLTQFDARAEHTREFAHELAKVDAPVRRKVKEHLREVEGELHINELHLEPEFSDLLLADTSRLALTCTVLINPREVGSIRDTVHNAQIRRNGFIRNLTRRNDDLAALHPPCRLDDDVIPLGDRQLPLSK